ncbi:MAG: hypothetical protein RLZZ422_2819, partial [Pseudomonadota bacterium]
HDIWVSDLTTQKTHLLAKLSSESIDGINKPQWFNFAGNLYFFNVAGRMQPNHLWVTDGTKAGTQQILHVKDGSCEWSDYLSWNNAPSYYHQLGQNIVFASYKQKSTDCIMQLWGLSAAKPTHPILLGEFDEVILLNPAPNTKLNYLQFLSGNNRWQTDGTQSGTYIIDKEPLRADWQKEEWIAPYGHQLPVLAITNQQEGWLMPDNDQTASGTELWWVSPNPKASYLLKDINTLPASVEGLKNLYRKGTDWYFEIDKQEWMIKADGEKLGSPQLVATLPSNIASTHNETEIAIIENSDHLAPPITKDKDYSEIKKEISLGFIYDGLLTKNSKNQSEQRIQFIWWQPKPNSNRQLIYTKSTEKYFISDITSTQYDIYALGESKLDSKKELLRFDPKNQRFTPVNNFSATPDSKYQPYSIKSISNGIFINGTDNSKDSNINESSKLWFINDKNQQLTLLKQGSTNEKINIMTLKLDKNTCYFDLAHKDGIQEPIELWMSQGTPETTHLMKKGVGFAYP